MSIVQGDHGYAIPFIVKKDTVIDLTGAAVEVAVERGGEIVNKQADILDPITGKCEVILSSSDLRLVGSYTYQWTAFLPDGRILSGNPIRFNVKDKLRDLPFGDGETTIIVPFARKEEFDELKEYVDNIVIEGGGSIVTEGDSNGTIKVNNSELKVYDDTEVTGQLAGIAREVDHTNEVVEQISAEMSNYVTKDQLPDFVEFNMRPVQPGETFTITDGPVNTAPSITSTFNLSSVDDATPISIPYTISDKEGGDLTVHLTLNDTVETQTKQSGSHTWDVGILSVGAYQLKLKVVDSGGLSSQELVFNVNVTASVPPENNTPPTITSTFNITEVNDSTSISVPYVIADEEGGSFTATLTKNGVSSTVTVGLGDNVWSVGVLPIGSHTLSIRVKDNGGLESNLLTFNLEVTATAVTGVMLDKTTYSLNVGSTLQLNAVIQPNNASNKSLAWSSSDVNIAIVSNSGLVTAISEGNAKITVTTEDGGFTSECNLTVSKSANNFDGTQNAYIQDSYMYVNPETILDTDIAVRIEGEPSHVYFSFSVFLSQINKNLSSATLDNASNVFNGVIPFAGEHSLSLFTSGMLDCPDTCYIISQNTVYVRIPSSIYENNSSRIQLALYSISERIPVRHNELNEEIIITDTIIDKISSLSAVNVTDGMHSGFANLPAGVSSYASIINGINSISGRYTSSVTDREIWFINATTRLNFKIPLEKLPVCDLNSVKQYLRDNELIFWIAK